MFPPTWDLDPDQIDRVAALAALLPRWELTALYRLRVVAARLDLTLNELLVVAELLVRDRTLSGSEIAGIVGLGAPAVTAILARLEERDLVHRDPDPHDARRQVVAASPEARAVLHRPLHDHDTRHLLDGLSASAADGVLVAVGRAADNGLRQVQRDRDRWADEQVRRSRLDAPRSRPHGIGPAPG